MDQQKKKHALILWKNMKMHDKILKTFMDENDAGAKTIREYLHILVTRLWLEGEDFSGKRPFGNSGWQYEIYKALIQGGFVEGSLDIYNDIEEIDIQEADKLMCDLIDHIFERNLND